MMTTLTSTSIKHVSAIDFNVQWDNVFGLFQSFSLPPPPKKKQKKKTTTTTTNKQNNNKKQQQQNNNKKNKKNL